MKPVTTPEFVVDAGAIAVIDGHDGVGHVLTMPATQEAIKRAKAHGIGAVAVRNSNHCCQASPPGWAASGPESRRR